MKRCLKVQRVSLRIMLVWKIKAMDLKRKIVKVLYKAVSKKQNKNYI